MDTLYEQLQILFLLLVVGCAARISGLVPKKAFDGIAVLTANVALPLFMLTSLPNASKDLTLQTLLVVLLAYVIYYILLTIGTKAGNLLFHLKDADAASHLCVMGTTCAGFMGLPIATAMFGSLGALSIGLYGAMDNVMMWTHKYFILGKHSPQGAQPIYRKLLSPQLICIVIGLVLAGFKADFSGNLIWDTLTETGNLAKYLGMLFLGGIIADFGKETLAYLKNMSYTMTVKMIVIPIVLALILKQIPFFSTPEIQIVVILAATPPMSGVPMFIRSLGMNEQFAGQCVIVFTALSLITLPLVYQLICVLLGV